MLVRLSAPTWTAVLAPWTEAEGRGRKASPVTLDAARLRTLMAREPGLTRALRALVREVEFDAGLSVALGGREELAIRVARLIEQRRVCVEIEAREPMVSETVEFFEPAPAPAAPATVEQLEHWIEIEVVGEDDEGLAGIRCELTLPSGRKVVQTTDRFGLIRVEGLSQASDCEIRFPELDDEAWEAL